MQIEKGKFYQALKIEGLVNNEKLAPDNLSLVIAIENHSSLNKEVINCQTNTNVIDRLPERQLANLTTLASLTEPSVLERQASPPTVVATAHRKTNAESQRRTGRWRLEGPVRQWCRLN